MIIHDRSRKIVQFGTCSASAESPGGGPRQRYCRPIPPVRLLSGCADRLPTRSGVLGLLRHGLGVAGGGDAISRSGQRFGCRHGPAVARRPAVALSRRRQPGRARLLAAGGRAADGADLRRRRGVGRVDRRHGRRGRLGALGAAVGGRMDGRGRGVRQLGRARSRRRARALSSCPRRIRLGTVGRGGRDLRGRRRRRAAAGPPARAGAGTGRRKRFRRRRGRRATDRRDRPDRSLPVHQPCALRGGRRRGRGISVAHLRPASRIRHHGRRGDGDR